MKVLVRPRPAGAQRADVRVLGVTEPAHAPRGLDRASRRLVDALIARGDFRGRPGELAVVVPDGSQPRVMVVGLGPGDAVNPVRIRSAAAAAIRRAREIGARTLATEALGAAQAGPEIAGQATAEGLVLGHYRFVAYRSERGSAPVRTAAVCADAATARALREPVARGVTWAEGVCVARDLANTPGQDLVPARLAERAREIGRAAGARVQVLGVSQIERLGMGALLAVGRGSVHEPRFVVLDRPAPRGARSRDTVVVIGKGITFDTGGISLKPRENMHRMKMDMAGAAAVLGMFSALPALDPPFRVVGLIASAENMPGPNALKPGDVVRALDGTTIEITNTDAEGRLVLADALGYARRFAPAAVIDLATLTGAVRLALGTRAAGLFTDDDRLAAELDAAGRASGERLWRLPCWDDYAPDLRSDTADLVNAAGPEGAASLAAVFLKRFARGMTWAHLDIAGMASVTGDHPLAPRGATGFGVRLLLEWLSRRASVSASSRRA